MTFTLERIPYAGPVDLYDGTEPTKSSATVVAKPAAPWQKFTFADLEKHDLRTVGKVIGDDAFQRIVAERKLRQTMPGAPWTSEARLPLHFVRMSAEPGGAPGVQEIAIVGFGEWQPTRYVVQVDSLWRVGRTR